MKSSLIFLCLLAVALFAEENSALHSALSDSAVAPTKTELIYRGRNFLAKSLQAKNREDALQAIAYLKNSGFRSVALPYVEEDRSYFALGMYDSAAACIVRSLRDENEIISVPADELFHYLKNLFILNSNTADSLIAEVQKSAVDEKYKKELPALLNLPFVEMNHEFRNQVDDRQYIYSETSIDTTAAAKFLDYADAFVNRYPIDDDAVWMKKFLVDPIRKKLDETREFAENPWKDKYYTGGAGFEVALFSGFFSGDAGRHLKQVETDLRFYLSFPFQYKRFTLDWFMMFNNSAEVTDEIRNDKDSLIRDVGSSFALNMIGVSLGVVVFDSHFFKAYPFIGYSFESKKDDNEYDSGSDHFSGFHFGAVADFRFWASRPRLKRMASITLSLRFRYMGTLTDFEFENKDGPSVSMGGLYNQFMIGLCLFGW